MDSKKKVIENSFLFTFSSVLVRAIGFLLLPVYTFFLTPEEYGTFNLINGFLQISIFIVALSLNSGIVRFFVDYQTDIEKLKRFLGSVILFVCVSGLLFITLGVIFKDILISILFEGVSFYPILLLAFLTVTFMTLHRMHQGILQALQNGKKITVINIVVFLTQASLNLLFIGPFHLGVTGMLLAQLIVYIGYVIFMVFDLSKNNLITYSIDFKLLREALKYSIPLLPHNLSTNIATFVSRVFINSNSSLAVVGLYSVATQFGMVIDIIQTSVHKAFVPWFFNSMKNKENNEDVDIVNFTKILLIAYTIAYMLIGLFSQEVIIFMTQERYLMAWSVIPILVLAYSVKSIYYFFVSILFYYKNASNKIFIATLTGSFADILLAYLLIPPFGMYGAALAFLIAKIIVVIIVLYISLRYDKVFQVAAMLRILIPSWLFMGIGLYFSYTKYMTEFNWLNFFYKVLVLLIYLLFLILTNKKLINMFIRSDNALIKRVKNVISRG